MNTYYQQFPNDLTKHIILEVLHVAGLLLLTALVVVLIASQTHLCYK